MEQDHLCLKCMSLLPEAGGVCPVCGANNALLQNQSHQLPCRTILAGRYFIGSTLGQGGFGITYMGYDLAMGLRVAIKEYYPEGFVTREQTARSTVMPLQGEKEAFFAKGMEKFMAEAQTLARFSGESSIVGVRDFFRGNGTAYIVMNYIGGQTLKQIAALRGGKLPTAEAMYYLLPVIRGLSKVHAAGLLHRDISPDNIIVQPDGHAVLLDFGAARQISADGEHSNTINVKHGYAPEEQYRTHGEQGPWTDIYAMCATIYKLTTGVIPPQAMDRIVTGMPVSPPSQLGADLTPAQEQAVMKGLSVDRHDRQQTMEELESALSGTGVTAKTPRKTVHTGTSKPIRSTSGAAAGRAVPGIKRDKKFFVRAVAAMAACFLLGMGIGFFMGKGGQKAAPAEVSADEPHIEEHLPSFPKTLLYDRNDLTITAIELAGYAYYCDLLLKVENSGSKSYSISDTWICVNGICLPGSSCYMNVAGGKTANGSVSIPRDALKAAGIEAIKELSFSLSVDDGDYSNTFETGPLSVTTDANVPAVHTLKGFDTVLVDQDGVRITAKPYSALDNGWMTVAAFCVENRSGEECILSSEDVSADGTMLNSFTYARIPKDSVTLILLDFDVESVGGAEEAANLKDYEFRFQLRSGGSYDILLDTPSIHFYSSTGAFGA